MNSEVSEEFIKKQKDALNWEYIELEKKFGLNEISPSTSSKENFDIFEGHIKKF